IGSPAMNFVTGTMIPSGFRTADGVLLPTLDQPADAVTYGMRPEHIHLDPDGIEIEIVVVEPTGSETMTIAKLGKQTITCVFRERIRVQPGEIIRVSPDISTIHLFDEAGNSIGSRRM
ncbi:MAG: ABC transporter ATP-binding protein, partial [Rhizobiaceae bacterium]|nr:ABC transporter ATP-binding protein [Rhizobiaceae bacterium]